VTLEAEPDDADVALRAAAGDERAFDILVRRHKDPVFRLARRYTGSPDDAYEVVQETFIAAWRAIRRYDPARPFGSWLRAIALNKCRDRSRRAAVRRFVFGSQPLESTAALAQADPAPSAADTVIEREALSALDRALAQLPAALKEPLLLTAIDGLSHHEAGEVLKLSPKAVEMRVYRARRELAKRLGDGG
jgi:RNA polymerase sigma-70 factor (ECF subfamily)